MGKRIVAVFLFCALCGIVRAETLYNGIVLPDNWPPKPQNVPKDPVTPYYIANPPNVIPIDIGRQLLVDDFLIENTTLTRGLHQAEYYPGNPIQEPSPYSGGMWFDPADGKLKMWLGSTMMESTDGVHWRTPPELQGKTLISGMHSSSIWRDPDATDPNKRYVAIYSITFKPAGACRYWIRFSPDGIDWADEIATNADCGDRSTAFYDPFRKVWVMSIRHGWGKPRTRRYWEVRDLVKGPYWNNDQKQGPVNRAPMWIGADSADFVRDDLLDSEWADDHKGEKPKAGVPCQLYNLDGLAYESLMLGFFSIWRGQPDAYPKANDVCMGFSRDGYHFSRPDRRPILALPDTDERNYGTYINMQSVTGGCLVMGDRLYIYTGHDNLRLGVLRRDGFVSMDAGPQGGLLTTRKITFNGKCLFVNVDDPQGELRVDVLDEQGNVIAPFSAANCQPLSTDKTLQAVSWQGAKDLSALAGKAVKFRFHLKNGSLYSFWVSADESGASHGYTGGGGPGFTGATDTVGMAAYRAVRPAPATGIAPAPVIWPLAGEYNNGVSVSLAIPPVDSAPGLTVRYTTNGADPAADSPVYSRPIDLAGNTIVKARAFAAGLQPSAVVQAEFSVKPDTTPPDFFVYEPRAQVLPAETKEVLLRVRTSEQAVCRYSTAPGKTFDEMGDSLQAEPLPGHAPAGKDALGTVHATKVTGLQTGGIYHFFIKARDRAGNVGTAEVAFAVGDVKAEPLQANLSPKEAVLAAPMALAPQGWLESPETAKGSASWKFTVPSDGAYIVWAKVQGPASSKDSFFVSADGGGEDVFDMEEDKKYEEFTWKSVNARSGWSPLTLNPRLFLLAKGAHTLTFRCREAGARLSDLIVTSDPAFKP